MYHDLLWDVYPLVFYDDIIWHLSLTRKCLVLHTSRFFQTNLFCDWRTALCGSNTFSMNRVNAVRIRMYSMILESFDNLRGQPTDQKEQPQSQAARRIYVLRIVWLRSAWFHRHEDLNLQSNLHLRTYWNSTLSSKNTSRFCFWRFIKSVHGTLYKGKVKTKELPKAL